MQQPPDVPDGAPLQVFAAREVLSVLQTQLLGEAQQDGLLAEYRALLTQLSDDAASALAGRVSCEDALAAARALPSRLETLLKEHFKRADCIAAAARRPEDKAFLEELLKAGIHAPATVRHLPAGSSRAAEAAAASPAAREALVQELAKLGIPRPRAGFEQMVATAARVQKPRCMQERTRYLHVGIPDRHDPTKMQTCWFDPASNAFHRHDGKAFSDVDVQRVQLLDADRTRLCLLPEAIDLDM